MPAHLATVKNNQIQPNIKSRSSIHLSFLCLLLPNKRPRARKREWVRYDRIYM
jgi:hypothetical protein